MKTRSLLFLCLLLALLTGAFFLFRSCNQEEIQMPWGVWKEIRKGLNDSPDNLAEAMDRMVDGKDPKAIFNWVRDELTTIPPIVGYNNKKDYRWGIAGLLRTGQGTPLEKGLLLKTMLEQIDIQAELCRGRWKEVNAGDLYQFNRPPFQSSSNIDRLNKLHDKAEITKWSEATGFPVDSISDELRTTLTSFLLENLRTRSIDWEKSLYYSYPVKAMIDSQWVYLNPALPEAEWGEHYSQREPPKFNYNPEEWFQPVAIRLRASYDDRSYSPFTLAEAVWPLDTLIGHDVRLNFKLLGPPEILLGTPVKEFESFVASIELLDPSLAEPDSFRITGDVVTTRGQVATKESAWNLFDKEIEKGADASKARSVSLKPPKVADFPTLLVEAEVKDESGNPLMGLTEEDFEILVNGEKVTHRMVINQPTPPRVLFLYDDSGSMPMPYVTHEKTMEIFQTIAKACQEINPDTEFAVSPFGDRLTKIHKLSPWINNVDQLLAYIKTTKSSNSHNWSALLGATDITDANMVILICDSDGTERMGEYAEQRFREGMPALVYGVKSNLTTQGEFEAMAEKTNGVHFLIEEQMAEAVEDIQKRIGETKNERYLLEVEVENEELPFMDLELQMANGDLGFKLPEIALPPVSARRPIGRNAITGIYIEIEYLGKTYTKRVAGVPLGGNSNTHPISQEMIDECNNALLGEYILHFEGSQPFASAVLDQKCEQYLSLTSLVDLLEEKDPKNFFTKLQMVSWYPDYPAKWPLVMSQNAIPEAFENRLSLWLFSEYPDKNGDFWQRLDQYPVSELFFPVQTGEEEFRAQVNSSLDEIFLADKNYRTDFREWSPMALPKKFALYRNGQFSLPYNMKENPDGAIWKEANYDNLTGHSRQLILPEDLSGEVCFVVENNNGNTVALQRNGALASRKLPIQLDREKSLIEQHHLWTKTLGMKMDTWMDLEGDKLAFIQVGTVAMKGLGQTESPEVLMKQVKEKIREFMLQEKEDPLVFFHGMDQNWLDLFNLSRNNISAILTEKN